MINPNTELLPHQVEGVEKLKHKTVGALYMEMGTGKTRTALELIHLREAAGKVDAVLWLCPCSVKQNLRDDIIKHCGELPANLIVKGIESLSSSDNLYLKLLELVQKRKVYLIVDESSLVKNPFAKRSTRIQTLSEHCKYKLILSGTPISRNYADLYNQWYILDWRILGYKSWYSFSRKHCIYKEIDNRCTGYITDIKDVGTLLDRIAPYTYQVKKEECVKLPEKYTREDIFYLTDEQMRHYEQIKRELLAEVDDFDSTTIYRLFTALQEITCGMRVDIVDDRIQSEPFFKDWRDDPRIEALRDKIAWLDDEKCIIFAKYDIEIQSIAALLTEMDISHEILTGKIPLKKREKAIANFRGESQVLVANKSCGAYGLNLQHCHRMIFYSTDFDYATKAQAEDRIHRLGQEHECYITTLVASGTVDEFISGNLEHKDGLLSGMKSYIKSLKKSKKKQKKLKKIS